MADAQNTTPDALNSTLAKYPFLKAEKEAGEKAVESKILAQSTKEQAEESAKAKVLGESAAAERAKYEEVKGLMKPEPVFKPTQETALDLGAIFSMIATMGVALGGSGKLSGMNALNAMGGMLQGYQQGRQDLFDKEKDVFEKELQSMKAHNEALLKDLEQYRNLLATDRNAAMAKQAEIIAKNPGVIAENLKAGKDQVAYDIAKSNTKLQSDILAKTIKAGLSKQLKEKDLSKVTGLESMANSLEKLKKEFKPEYASLGILGFGADLEYEAKRRLGTEEGAKAVKWWSDYARLQAPERHSLFGATLTGNELKNYQEFTAKKGDAPNIVLTQLQGQIDYAQNTADQRRRSYEAAGYSVPEDTSVDFVDTYSARPSAPATPVTAAPSATTPTATYKTADEVRAAVNSGTITRDQGIAILKKDFGYK